MYMHICIYVSLEQENEWKHLGEAEVCDYAMKVLSKN